MRIRVIASKNKSIILRIWGLTILMIVGLFSIGTILPSYAYTPNNVTIINPTNSFNVTVPTSLPVWLNSKGEIQTINDAKIINNGTGELEIVDIKISTSKDWSLIDYYENTDGLEVGSKKVGFRLNENVTTQNGWRFDTNGWPRIASNKELRIDYDVTIAPQQYSLNEEIATVTFTFNVIETEQTPIPDPLPDEGDENIPPDNPSEDESEENPEENKIIPLAITSHNRDLVGYTGASNEDLIIPEIIESKIDGQLYRVEEVSDKAFADCNNLRSITLPDTVTKVGANAFYFCHNLTSITLSKNIKSIGDLAFYRCEKLVNISLPNRLITIGYGTFEGCKSIERITIPKSVTRIDDLVFSNCLSLKTVNLHDNINYIGEYAFHKCENVKGLNVSSGVSYIGHNAFYHIPISEIVYTGTAEGYPWGGIEDSLKDETNTKDNGIIDTETPDITGNEVKPNIPELSDIPDTSVTPDSSKDPIPNNSEYQGNSNFNEDESLVDIEDTEIPISKDYTT